MKVIKVKLDNESILEKVYERIISQCKNFFGVKNEDVSFYFVPDYNNLSLVMGIHRDAEAEFCERYLDNPALSFTGASYVRVFTQQQLYEYCICDGVKILPINEIRYVKLHSSDVLNIATEVLCKLLKINWKNAKVVKFENGYVFYLAKEFHFLSLVDKNEFSKIADYTERVEDLFI